MAKKNPNSVSSRTRARAADPETQRLLSLAEDGLRRLGFTERTIRARRKQTRAVIEARLRED